MISGDLKAFKSFFIIKSPVSDENCPMFSLRSNFLDFAMLSQGQFLIYID